MPQHAFGANRELRFFLAPHGVDCRLILGDLDVSSLVRSVSITATAGEPTIVSVDLVVEDCASAEGMVATLGLTMVTHAELLERLSAKDREEAD